MIIPTQHLSNFAASASATGWDYFYEKDTRREIIVGLGWVVFFLGCAKCSERSGSSANRIPEPSSDNNKKNFWKQKIVTGKLPVSVVSYCKRSWVDIQKWQHCRRGMKGL